MKLWGNSSLPIQIHPVFFIMAAAIGWLNSQSFLGVAVWTGVILISILVHEFGHALTALAFGQRARIDLVALGGLTTREGKKISGWKNFIVVLNGPLAGLSLGALAGLWAYGMGEKGGLFYEILIITLYVNVFWTAMNLLPIQPLDGGHLLLIILEGIFGLKGVRFAFLFSLILAGGFSLFLFANQALIGGMFFLLFAFESYRTWSSLKEASPVDEDINLQQLLKQGEENLERGRLGEAEHELNQVRTEAERGILHQTATLLLARLYHDQGRLEETAELLMHDKQALNEKGMEILHRTLIELGKWEEALKWGKKLYEESPTGELALLNAKASAALNEEEQTIGWLHCAQREGITTIQQVIEEPEFNHLRAKGALREF